MPTKIDFEWDPNKARINIRKHDITFERATAVFLDPNLISIPDEEHSQTEERWITIGADRNGVLLVLVHTFIELADASISIRMISARKAVRSEIGDYEKRI